MKQGVILGSTGLIPSFPENSVKRDGLGLHGQKNMVVQKEVQLIDIL